MAEIYRTGLRQSGAWPVGAALRCQADSLLPQGTIHLSQALPSWWVARRRDTWGQGIQQRLHHWDSAPKATVR